MVVAMYIPSDRKTKQGRDRRSARSRQHIIQLFRQKIYQLFKRKEGRNKGNGKRRITE